MSILYTALTIGITIGLILFGITLLPDANGLPAGIQEAIYTGVNYVKAYSLLIDFNTLFLIFSIVIATEVTILGIKITFWIYRLFLKGGAN